ncbi:hypothetical protein [Streptococcus pluranimalium]|uniref:hypothetical protein n=1 Tax=Streptococcus pluranimalium TaxID=82348 RepID=UPI003F68F30F
MDKEHYDGNKFWREKYHDMLMEFGDIINKQQDIIAALKAENKSLKRENWNMKQTKRRRR